MSASDFNTQANVETLATEVACLKATVTYLLKAIGQVDASKAVLNLEKFISNIEDPKQAEIFNETLQQIKLGYRQ